MKEMLIVWLLMVCNRIDASPFVLTEHYIQEFQGEIDSLNKLAATTNFHEESFEPNQHNETDALKESDEFDFIVIGGGTAGGIIATRLTEIPEWKVLLLEAGAPESPAMKVPALRHLLEHTPYNWGYTTESQESWCLGMEEKKCSAPGGKALGGSTSINSMLYTRGNHRDYDVWADQGNDGWCFNDVLPYFQKSENAHLHHFDRKFHRQGGPVQVEDVQHVAPLTEHFIHAAKELGMKVVDYNGKEQIGVAGAQVTTKHGRRNSITEAYLKPASGRKNLVVKPLSHVLKIIINPHTKEAAGVKYLHDGHLRIAKATKEVILSAGAYNSPQLLLLSGVGPKEQLEHLKIPVVEDLPVGQHLKDHVGFDVHFVLDGAKDVADADALVHWMKDGTGPLASTGTEAVAYIKTAVSKEHADYPDVELTFSPHTHTKQLRIKKDVYETWMKPMEEKKTFTMTVMLTHPASNGDLKLKSHDPLNWPHINSNQLSDPDDHDVTTLIAGIRKACAIGEASALKELGAKLYQTQVPGCEQHEFGTDAYWTCAVRHVAYGMRHATGGCRMGPAHDKSAVVDNKLKVHGVHKLRVADASVIPISVTGHVNAPVMMVGEKAADLIKEEWK